MVIEKAGVDAEVAKLSTLFSVWRNQRWANESEVGRLPMLIEALEQKIGLYVEDVARIEPQTMQDISHGADGAQDALPVLTPLAMPCEGW
jgi:hypothetical protein